MSSFHCQICASAGRKVFTEAVTTRAILFVSTQPKGQGRAFPSLGVAKNPVNPSPCDRSQPQIPAKLAAPCEQLPAGSSRSVILNPCAGGRSASGSQRISERQSPQTLYSPLASLGVFYYGPMRPGINFENYLASNRPLGAKFSAFSFYVDPSHPSSLHSVRLPSPRRHVGPQLQLTRQ